MREVAVAVVVDKEHELSSIYMITALVKHSQEGKVYKSWKKNQSHGLESRCLA